MELQRPEAIYEALFDDEAYARLPEIVAAAANARTAMLGWAHLGAPAEVNAHAYLTSGFLTDYGRHLHEDPWHSYAQTLNNIILPYNHGVTPEEFSRSGIYNNVIRVHGDDTFHGMGGSYSAPLGTAHIGLQRGRRAQAFDLTDRDRLLLITPHIWRVLRVRGELSALRREQPKCTEEGNQSGLARIVTRADGRVIDCNEAGETYLAAQGALQRKSGRLLTAHEQDNATLSSAIARATSAGDPASSVLALRDPQSGNLYITVTPLRRAEFASEPRKAALLFRPPHQESSESVRYLQELFRLTHAEACIALDFSRGFSTAEVAVRRGVRMNTIKSQVKAILAKTGVRRQTELVILVSTLHESSWN